MENNEEMIEKKKKILIENKAKSKAKAQKTIEDYKSFAVKGNVIDLAIGVTIGSAFTNIINALVINLITPIISLITNKVDLSTLFIALDGKRYASLAAAKEVGAIVISYGAILNAVLNFFIISIILFIVFKYISKVRKSNEKGVTDNLNATTKVCKYCRSKIDVQATRCPFCTSEIQIEDVTKKTNK
ncbi:MAG: large conductance mechanosensitive channel protein MscL [Clostridia bacterium]